MRAYLFKLLNWGSALLLGMGLVALQVLLGGWWYAAFAIPGYLLIGVAAFLGGLGAVWSNSGVAKPWCFFIAVVFASYLFWRQAESVDPLMARADTWLLLGGLAVYFTTSWGMRGAGPRWLLLGILFSAAMVQVLLAVAQFATENPFHPLAGLAVQFRLPDGKVAVSNLGLITGTLHARTALSGVLEVSTFLALGVLVWGRAPVWVKLLLLWVCMAGFAGMVICLSRSAYLALPVGLIVFALASFFIVQRGVVAHRLPMGLGALALVALAVWLGLATGWESVAVWLRLGEMGVDQYRESLWSITVPPMLKLAPVFGTGANSFEHLARRYRGNGFIADPIHAHSDWLQLLVEYGWVGLTLGTLFFLIHMVSGWRSIMKLVREAPSIGLLPQGMDLGLVTGSLAALAAIGAHVVFDYSLHLPAVAMMAALCAGWLASSSSKDEKLGAPAPRWLRPLALVGAVPGLILALWVWREAPAERKVVEAENALVPLNAERVADLCERGLELRPNHPRLHWLAGVAAREQARKLAADDLRSAVPLADSATKHFRVAAKARPHDVFVQSEFAKSLDIAASIKLQLALLLADPFRSRSLRLAAEQDLEEAWRSHLRCIGRDPDHARGYEGLARHYLLQEFPEKARRLYRLASSLTGAAEARSALKFIDENFSAP
jgi:O-antigen ligase